MRQTGAGKRHMFAFVLKRAAQRTRGCCDIALGQRPAGVVAYLALTQLPSFEINDLTWVSRDCAETSLQPSLCKQRKTVGTQRVARAELNTLKKPEHALNP